MPKWTRRVTVALGAAAGLLGLSMAAGFAAAPLSSASADRDSAHAAALGVPGTVTVSESNASADPESRQASWSALTVAGTSVLGVDESGWSGSGAGAGAVIDALNSTLCAGPVPLAAGAGVNACVILLSASATTENDQAVAGGSVADITGAVFVGENAYGADVFVLPSSAVASNFCTSNEGGADLVAVLYQAGGPETVAVREIGATKATYPAAACSTSSS